MKKLVIFDLDGTLAQSKSSLEADGRTPRSVAGNRRGRHHLRRRLGAMHPQIRQVGPGNCSIGGMTLEPVKATAEVGENHELTDMTRRFWVDLDRKADELRSDGATTLFLVIEHKPGGVIAIADPIKATTQTALDTLRNDGIQIVMLTGDDKTTAEAVARKLGIKEIEADVLPAGQEPHCQEAHGRRAHRRHGGRRRERRSGSGRGLCRHRDGAGTEVAIQSAGITLVKGDLAGIARAIVLSRVTMRNIRENPTFAFAPTTQSAFQSPPASTQPSASFSVRS